MDSKPSLLIYADDVKCGHGATAGHIDDDTLFYMRSRGIDPETASQILIHAFASEIIESVPDEPVRDYLDGLFLNTVSGKVIPGVTTSGRGNPAPAVSWEAPKVSTVAKPFDVGQNPGKTFPF